MPSPPWLLQADTLSELARKIGVDADGLATTVRRFNGFAVEGKDRDFARGESAYDRFYGDPAHAPNPNLGTIDKPPFYAIQVFPGAIGTKGGPKVDLSAQVLKVDGEPLRGLYAAGNVMAGVTGPGYPGAGSTIGTAMTFGFLAAQHAATQKG
jgi:3-oxosteroid 1-dehydrogenase